MNVLVLHGPNLNLLGKREPAMYGSDTLSDINARIEEAATTLGLSLRIAQHNSEGDMVEEIHRVLGWAHGIVLNAAAYTHYSIAIRDALSAVAIPVIEVHLTNVFARERFRHVSVVSPIAVGVICGLGGSGYVYALEHLKNMAEKGLISGL